MSDEDEDSSVESWMGEIIRQTGGYPFNFMEAFGGMLDPTFIDMISAQSLSDNINEAISRANFQEDYQSLREALKGSDPSLAFDTIAFSMSGMEYAVYKEDWKMVLIFFLAGADPEKSYFNGYVQTQASTYGEDEPVVYPNVVALLNAHEEGQPLGVSVLRAILAEDRENSDKVSDDSSKVEACVDLIEILHRSSTPVSQEEMMRIHRNMLVLSPKFHWETSAIGCARQGEFLTAEITAGMGSLVVQRVKKFQEHLTLTSVRDALEEVLQNAIDSKSNG